MAKRASTLPAASLTGPGPKRSKSTHLHLRVSQIPLIQDKGQWFEVNALLLGNDGHLHTDADLKLARPQLCYADSQEMCEDKSILELEPAAWPVTVEDGKLKFEARINMLSRDSAGRDFCLRLAAHDSSVVEPTFSSALTIVSHRLSLNVLGSTIDSNINTVTWYNQMGGGSNCIQLDIECRDAVGTLCQTPVPLKLTLLYDDDKEPVRTQSILTIQEGSHLKTDRGRATIKVRIEEVSRRHQNRLFALKVAPDTTADPLCASVAPDTSPSINVLSKITPRDRRARQQDIQQKAQVGAGAGGLTSYAVPSSVHGRHLTANPPYHPIPDDDDRSKSSHGEGAVGSDEAIQALGNVLGWIDGTLKCLCDMRWQPVGFEQGLAGPDQSKPLFAMSNPNARIEVQLAEYRAKVQGSLSTILTVVEPILEGKEDQTEADEAAAAAVSLGDLTRPSEGRSAISRSSSEGMAVIDTLLYAAYASENKRP